MTTIGPVQIFFFILRVIPVILLIFALAFLYTALLSFPEDNNLDRSIGDLADNIIHHNLTSARAVFDADELDKYDGSNEEPYVRYCNYGYYLEIEKLALVSEEEETQCSDVYSEDCADFCMDVCELEFDELVLFHATLGMDLYGNCACYSGTCKCRSDMYDEFGWRTRLPGESSGTVETKFGYSLEKSLYNEALPDKGYFAHDSRPDLVTSKYYVSVSDEDSVIPAIMTLTLWDTVLTRISCLVETAYNTMKAQEMPIHCLLLYPDTPNHDCWLPIRQSGDDICIYYKRGGDITDIDCRRLPGYITDSDKGIDIAYTDISYKNDGTLVASPQEVGNDVRIVLSIG